jgi:hypothetical protein
MALTARIFNIVMDQGEIVDQLDSCGGGYGLRWITSHPSAAEKANSGPNEFAGFFAARTPMLILPAHMIP